MGKLCSEGPVDSSCRWWDRWRSFQNLCFSSGESENVNAGNEMNKSELFYLYRILTPT